MFHKIKEIKTEENYILIAKFENGKKKKYNMKQLIRKYDFFEELKNENLFKMAYIEQGGYGIVWNDDIDLSSEEIWENGEDI